MVERLFRINKYREAFMEPHNIVGMAAVTALSVAVLNPLPFIAGAVAEGVYMLCVPDSKWYAEKLAKKEEAEAKAKRGELKSRIYPKLDRDSQNRFNRLEYIRSDVETNSDLKGDAWFQEILRKLDFLSEKFLDFGYKEIQYKKYLQDAVEDARKKGFREVDIPYGDVANERIIESQIKYVKAFFEKEVAQLESVSDNSTETTDPKLKAVLDKRLSVMRRRRDFVNKIGSTLINIKHQQQLLEDTFGLIGDEILTRNPEEILSEIDDVVIQTNAMTSSLEDLVSEYK